MWRFFDSCHIGSAVRCALIRSYRVLLARPIQLSKRKLLLAVRRAAVALIGRCAAALEIRLQ